MKKIQFMKTKPTYVDYCSSMNGKTRRFASTHTQQEWRIIFESQAKRNKIPIQKLSQLDINKLDDKASSIVNKEFKGSMYLTLVKLFPEIEWSPLKFKNTKTVVHQSLPHGYWKESTNYRKYFDDLGRKLGVTNLDDWYEKL